MSFKIYEPYSERAGKLPFVTLSNNAIVLNKLAMEKLKAGSIELAYDRAHNVIKISASAKGTHVLSKTLYGKGFFNHFAIKKRGRFAADYHPDENALYVDLKKNLR